MHILRRLDLARLNLVMILQNDGLKLLKESFEIDSSYREMAKTDNDFDSIRNDPRFQTLIFLE